MLSFSPHDTFTLAYLCMPVQEKHIFFCLSVYCGGGLENAPVETRCVCVCVWREALSLLLMFFNRLIIYPLESTVMLLLWVVMAQVAGFV